MVVSGHPRFLVIGGGASVHWKRIRRCFAGSPDREIVRANSSLAECILEECRNFLPCVLIVDHDCLSKVDPLLFARKAEYGRLVPVLVFVRDETSARCVSLLRMGCMGFLRPESPPWQIRRAVEAVASGELWVPRLLLSQMCRDYLSSHDPCRLTDREEEILALLAQGHKNREIGASLFISRDTVRWHIRAIYAKLGIHDRQSAASYATDRSLKPLTYVPANGPQSLAI
jgi:DNA-binding NarL/FixJ family response regulator